MVSFFFLSSVAESAEDLVQGAECILSPDNESAKLTSWGQLLKIQAVDVADLNAWDVTECLSQLDIFVCVYNKRALAEVISSVSELALTSSQVLMIDNFLHIFVGTNSPEELNSLLGFFLVLNPVVDYKWDLMNLANSVPPCHNERDNGASSECGGNCMSLLLKINSAVPSPPCLEWGEHTTLAAHVSESSLAASVGS